MGSRFVEIPVVAMRDEIARIATGATRAGASVSEVVQGREVVVDITLPHGATVRIYTSFAVGAQTLRDCDAGAVRIVVGVHHDGRFHPIRRSQKLLRTAPITLPHEERVAAFLGRFTEAVRDGWRAAARGTAKCPQCGGPMAVRKAKATGAEFLGCLDFKKGCRGTRPVPNED